MAIAIIDDSVTNLAILKHVSAKIGIRDIVAFSDPEVAIKELSRLEVDMIMVDYEMPKKNGVEVISTIRAGRINRETPIIMVTSVLSRDVRMAALSAGATDFLNKPVDPNELRARIVNLLRLKATSVA
jgi:putative two-component system response regulator